MDTGDSRSNARLSGADQSHGPVTERTGELDQRTREGELDHRTRDGELDQRTREGEGSRLVDVLLSGGAPWGFTLRGGREHREPLLITKVEEGSTAAAASLQAGDELVSINAVPLSGFRQEAICLVKGSHRTLALLVKRNGKMVDIVAQKMPSESDVHVARSFLTKILRSSMRKNRFKGRNEPLSRPHSWHAIKFNESQSETAKTQSPPPPVWQTRYDASSSSTDLSSGWDQPNLRRVSDQFSSLGSMDSLEHAPHACPTGRLSPGKSPCSAEHLGGGGGGGGGGGKRDSAYSSFSTSSGTPDHTLSGSNAASAENVPYKVSQWDSGGRHGNGRHSQSLSEGGARQDDRPGYLQLAGGGQDAPPRPEEQPPGPRHPGAGRSNSGPVWHVPEKKKTPSPSPPPPPPPVRSDSFAATKVHEKGLVSVHPEGPDAQVHPKAHGRGPDRGTDAADNEGRRSLNAPAKSGAAGLYMSTGSYAPNQLSSNKLYSQSTTDVRVGPPPYAYLPCHHPRQYSDESPFCSQSRGSRAAAKPQYTSGYYSSMHELPTSSFPPTYGQNQSQSRTAGMSLSSAVIDQNAEGGGGGHARYYCVTARQPGQDRRAGPEAVPGGGGGGGGGGGDRTSLSLPAVGKGKYPPPQPHPGAKDSNGYGKLEDAAPLRHKQPVGPEAGPGGGQRRHTTQNAETHHTGYPPGPQAAQRRSLPAHPGPAGAALYPQATPMLHSPSQDAAGPAGRPGDGEGEDGGPEAPDAPAGRTGWRADRFATTLRNEIQLKKANLQKSGSAAAPGGACEAGEERPDPWGSDTSSAPSPPDASFTSTYKDHLKEAQARVLKATSFRRRDLVLLEHPGPEAPPAYPCSALPRRDAAPLPSVSEAPPLKPASAGGAVTRIGARKRMPPEKKGRSFSEPDKIHEVGVDDRRLDPVAPPESAGPPGDGRKPLDTAGKPAFPKPHPRQSGLEGRGEAEARVPAPGSGAEEGGGEVRARAGPPAGSGEDDQGRGAPYPAHGPPGPEQHRLGTFAEYEATWNTQKMADARASTGRYRSADNILDPGGEERSKPACVHERSRSSPTAESYGQKISAQGKKSDCSQVERLPAQQDHAASRFSEREQSFPEPPPQLAAAESPEHRHPAPVPAHHRPTSTTSRDPSDPALAGPDDPPYGELQAGPRGKRPPPPRLDEPGRPETTPPPPPSSPEPLPGSQGGAPTARPPSKELDSAPAPPSESRAQRQSAEQGGGGARPPGASSNPRSAPPPRPPSPRGPAAVAEPPMDGQRSPSPQFAPQRLTDKPPASLRDENSNRMENVMENNNNNNNPAVKKVPIKIVHSESPTEKEGRQYLLHSAPPAAPPEPGGPSQVGSSLGAPDLGAPAQSYSLFCAYSRLPEPAADTEPEPEPAPHADPRPRAESPAGPLREQGALGGALREQGAPAQQQQPPEAPSSNGVGPRPPALQEEQKREELARCIMGQDRTLVDILDQSRRRTTMDLMEGIFPRGEQLSEGGAHQRRKTAPKQASPPRAAEERSEEDSLATAVALVTSSAYYSTSAPKAELLIKMKDMQEQSDEPESEDEMPDNDGELASKKQELIASLSRKLAVLREARKGVAEDVQENNALGEEVELTVTRVCAPNQLDKFRMFVGDLDKVVSLLLSLSGRLARVENALNTLEPHAAKEERRTLTEKRSLLIRQHEDAKELKENLDRRESLVYGIMAASLSADGLADYRHFVKMKSALIIEQRKLDDKIKLGDEQLKCLTDSLPPEQRPPL